MVLDKRFPDAGSPDSGDSRVHQGTYGRNAARSGTAAGSGGAASGSAPLIELVGVEKSYRMGRLDYPALRGVDLVVGVGELVAVVGPSGSGKTTILNVVTGIDRPTAGSVTVGGLRIDALGEEELAVWRGAHVGRRRSWSGRSGRSNTRSACSTATAPPRWTFGGRSVDAELTASRRSRQQKG